MVLCLLFPQASLLLAHFAGPASCSTKCCQSSARHCCRRSKPAGETQKSFRAQPTCAANCCASQALPPDLLTGIAPARTSSSWLPLPAAPLPIAQVPLHFTATADPQLFQRPPPAL